METVHDQLAWHEAQVALWESRASNEVLVARYADKMRQARLHREAADAIREALEKGG